MSSKNKVQPRALKAGEAAKYLGISRRHLTDLANEGQIPYARVSARCHLYKIEDLERFLDRFTVGKAVA